MSGSKIDELMQMWACTLPEDHDPPFASHQHLYATVDAITFGDVPWQTFSVTYNGPVPDGAMPSWMIREYDVWFRDPRLVLRNQYSNPDFADDIDWVPKRSYSANGKRKYRDFMSGDWAWNQAVSGISQSAPARLCAHAQYRIFSQRTRGCMARHWQLLSLAVTRRLSLLRPAKTSTTHST